MFSQSIGKEKWGSKENIEMMKIAAPFNHQLIQSLTDLFSKYSIHALYYFLWELQIIEVIVPARCCLLQTKDPANQKESRWNLEL